MDLINNGQTIIAYPLDRMGILHQAMLNGVIHLIHEVSGAGITVELGHDLVFLRGNPGEQKCAQELLQLVVDQNLTQILHASISVATDEVRHIVGIGGRIMRLLKHETGVSILIGWSQTPVTSITLSAIKQHQIDYAFELIHMARNRVLSPFHSAGSITEQDARQEEEIAVGLMEDVHEEIDFGDV